MPKSVPLYIDSTQWIVGLATGAFLLTGSILTTHPDSTRITLQDSCGNYLPDRHPIRQIGAGSPSGRLPEAR